jgi:hypothetical protein
MLHHQLGKLASQVGVVAKGKVRIDPSLQRSLPALVEPSRLLVQKIYPGHVGIGRSPPQRQALAQQLCGTGSIAGYQRPLAFGGQHLEHICVQLAGAHNQRITWNAVRDPLGAERIS